GNINPLYRGQYYDPDDTYTVPYGAGVQTIVYRPDAVQTEIRGYADLWDASLLDRVGIIGNYRVINGMALKVLGYSYNTEDETEIRAAGDLLYQLAPNIRLIKDDYIQDDLISGEIDAAVMYTSQVTAAIQADPSLAVVYPEEGIGFGIMAMFIPQHAPNAVAAHKFIDYILDAENGAECFTYLGYFCTSSASETYLSDDMRTALTLPADIRSAQMEMIKTISNESSDLHMEIWTTFRGLCE
ncbi:MAG: spermidine/putrescine ABC transporter substrate-binding protein, partial [Eubacteriales bacterium]